MKPRTRKPPLIAGGILALLLGSLTFSVYLAMAAGSPGSGTPEDPFVLYNTSTVSLGFDAYDVAEEIDSAEIQITATANDYTNLAAEAEYELSAPTANKVPIYDIVKDLPNGIYYFRARVIRANRESSDWSQEYAIAKNWRPPPPPPACRLFW